MIKISRRSYSSHILSILHFNYPYFAEHGDGLLDEIGSFSWTRSGNAKLVGSEIPADAIISGTPKFGYRCLHSDANTDFIAGTALPGKSISMSALHSLEASFWIRPTATGAGNILLLKNGSAVNLSLILTADNKLCASSSSIALNITSNTALALNTWQFVRLQISGTECRILIGANIAAQTTIDASALPDISGLQLGGFKGQIDEFILRDTFTSEVPAEPEKAVCSVSELGGFGIGASGNVTINANCVMNTTAKFVGTSSTSAGYLISNTRTGKFGSFNRGDEIMLLNMATGAYGFYWIAGISGQYLKFTEQIAPDFMSASDVQIIRVEHFNTLTVNSGITVSANSWDGCSGGIIAFRCKGDCTINGSLITSGTGRPRTDLLVVSHGTLPNNFIMNTGGCLFITCGGTFTAPSTARIGAAWSGAGKGGTPVSRAKGNPGGAGYGGAGGSDTDNAGTGGKGGVGGGGGGANGAAAGDAGSNGTTGGKGGVGGAGVATDIGGTQGVTPGGNSPSSARASGGGGAGGKSGGSLEAGNWPESNPYCAGVNSGANLILITNTLKVDSAAISTGGEGGNSNNEGTGGGGTGFCYIACERMI